MQKVLKSNGITSETVLNSNLLEKLLNDLAVSSKAASNRLPRPLAKKFLINLVNELDVEIPNETIALILTKCSQDNVFSLSSFREFVNEAIPSGN